MPSGGGIHTIKLRVQPGGSRSWVLRFRRGGKPRRVTLGQVGTVTADQARAAALALLAREKAGGPSLPLPASGPTLARFATEYVERRSASWKQSTHKATVSYGCRANDVCTVMSHEDGRVVLAQADGERRCRPSGNAARYLGLYDTERIELRAGDRIRWTRNRKAPAARFGHPQAPDLVNGGEAEILEIGYKRVRFRDGEREFGLALTDPQLRHLDHAYCSTVHAAQGWTARAAIAVLDAGGRADRELLHVELSRVSEAFLLLTDDREALVERLEAHDGSEDGARSRPWTRPAPEGSPG